MKGLKFTLYGVGMILVAVFCLLGGINYGVALAFGIIFVIAGVALMVLGLLVNESLSELKNLRFFGASKSSEGQQEDKGQQPAEKEE